MFIVLSMGPFCVTRYNPTYQLTDPIKSNPLQVEKFGPNSTEPSGRLSRRKQVSKSAHSLCYMLSTEVTVVTNQLLATYYH